MTSKLADLERRLGSRGRPHLRVLDPDEQKNVWAVRKAALPLLLSLPGDKKPIAFVEDTAVEPSRLPEFIRGFEDILAGRDTEGSFYAHAGAGCLHIRPLINLKDPAEIRKMDTLAQEICELVLDFGGAMSGEHGDGLARSHFNEKVFGPRVYDAFKRLKAAFDPAGIMNPGKVVDAPAMTDNLRYGGDYRAEELPVVYPYQRHGGFAGAVELCNGAGVCRKELVGTMCPSFMATKEEEHSTRGRANLLRALLDGRLPPEKRIGGPGAPGARPLPGLQGLQGRVPVRGGHGPAQVRLPAPLLPGPAPSARRPDLRGAGRAGPLGEPVRAARALGRPAGLGRLPAGPDDRFRPAPEPAEPRPPAVRALVQERGNGLPAGHAAGARWRSSPTPSRTTSSPQIGIAACRVLWALGYRVVLAPEVCCGRPAISRGLLDRAGRLARESVRALGPIAAKGTPIVGLEPSCLFSFRDEIPELVPEEERAVGRARRAARGALRRVPGRSLGGARPAHRRAAARGPTSSPTATATRRRSAGPARSPGSSGPPAPRSRWRIQDAAGWPEASATPPTTTRSRSPSASAGSSRRCGNSRPRTRWWRRGPRAGTRCSTRRAATRSTRRSTSRSTWLMAAGRTRSA